MTRQKKIELQIKVKGLLLLFIEEQGAFDWWLDGWYLFPLVAKTANCSVHLVKKIFFNEIFNEEEGRKFLSNFEY